MEEKREMEPGRRARRPYGYVRASTTIEADRESEQLQALRDLIVDYGSSSDLAIVMERSLAGFSLDRQGVADLLHAAESGIISEVVVTDMSRLTRSALELERLLQHFSDLGVTVRSLASEEGDA